MMLSIPTLFLVGVLHYYGATATAVTADPPQCNACCQGQPGLPGNGIPGVPGVPGIPGSMGPKGDIGNAGPIGIGEGGPMGPSGFKGDQGLLGLQGLPGKVGPRGVLGSPGPGGPEGVRGPSGLKGNIGIGQVGPHGPAGVKGEKGDTRISHKSAFTAVKTTDQKGTGVLITFDETSLNLGNDFDLNTGTFTCRVAGTYVFNYKVQVKGGRAVVNLEKNGDRVVDSTHTGGHNALGLTGGCVINLQEGDQVWIKAHNNVQTYASYQGANRLTHFYGYLLYET